MKVYLEPQEVERMEQAATCQRDLLLIRVLFRLGCRISEALGIAVKDIDFKQGAVTIEHLKARVKLSCPHCGARLGRSHVFCPKCGAEVEKALAEEKKQRRVRTLPLDSETMKMLADFIRRDKTKGLIFMVSSQNSTFDSRLGKHGGTKYRNPKTGRLMANLNRGKPWYCPKSPAGAHHWLIVGHMGRCKYCSEERDFKLPKE